MCPRWYCVSIYVCDCAFAQRLGQKLRDLLLKHGSFEQVEVEVLRYKKEEEENKLEGGWYNRITLEQEGWTPFPSCIILGAQYVFMRLAYTYIYIYIIYIYICRVLNTCCISLKTRPPANHLPRGKWSRIRRLGPWREAWLRSHPSTERRNGESLWEERFRIVRSLVAKWNKKQHLRFRTDVLNRRLIVFLKSNVTFFTLYVGPALVIWISCRMNLVLRLMLWRVMLQPLWSLAMFGVHIHCISPWCSCDSVVSSFLIQGKVVVIWVGCKSWTQLQHSRPRLQKLLPYQCFKRTKIPSVLLLAQYIYIYICLNHMLYHIQ